PKTPAEAINGAMLTPTWSKIASTAQAHTTIAAAERATLARDLIRETRRFSRDLSMDWSCCSCLAFCFLLFAPGIPILLMGFEREPFFSMEDWANLLITRRKIHCKIKATTIMMPIAMGRLMSHSLVFGSDHQLETSLTASPRVVEPAASVVISASEGNLFRMITTFRFQG